MTDILEKTKYECTNFFEEKYLTTQSHLK